MKISEKYRHIGYSSPGVPDGWQPIVEKAIIEIERKMWVQWLPLSVKRLIHKLATGNSVARVESKFWYAVRSRLTNNQIITDIKDKFATLRIYGFHGNEIDEIITEAENECIKTCEKCGSRKDVKMVNYGWIYNLCAKCRKEKESKKTPSKNKVTKE